MPRPLLRVDLSAGTADFQSLVVEPGVRMLDRDNRIDPLLGKLLGRFAAEPVWQGNVVGFYLRDEQGGRLSDVDCEPISEHGFRGPFKKEWRELKRRLERAAPQGPAAESYYRFVCQGILNPQRESGFAALNCQFYKYRDAHGDWRLVWCYGLDRKTKDRATLPVVCQNPDCRRLLLPSAAPDQKCPTCAKPLHAAPKKPPRKRGAALLISAVLLLLALAGLYFHFQPRAVLTGRVVSAAGGHPIADASVRLESTSLDAVSDADGKFRIERAPTGHAIVHVSAAGFQEQSSEVELTAGRESEIEAVLDGLAQVAGRVVWVSDGKDSPIPLAQVRLDGMSEIAAETDSSGAFRLLNLPPGPTRLRVSAKGFRSQQVSASAEVDVGPILVALAGDNRIEGKVVYATDASFPVADAEIKISDRGAVATRTDPNGRFVLTGLPPSPVALQAAAPGFRPSRVQAQPGSAPLSVSLEGDGLLTGQVVRGDTNQAVPGAEIRLSGTPFNAKSDDKGLFRMEKVPSGRAQLSASATGLAALVRADVTPERETPVRIVLLGTVTLTARVIRKTDNAPIEGATVAVEGTQIRATTDAGGQFELKGLPQSALTLKVSAKGCLFKDVTEKPTEQTQRLKDIVLSPLAAVVGAVARALDGQPIDGAEVSLAGTETKVRTGPDGKFTVSTTAGPATIDVTAAGFVAQQFKWDLTPGTHRLSGPVVLVGDTTVSGATIDADDKNAAVPNAQLEIRVAGVDKPVKSGPNGAFRLGEVPAGLVEITARAPGYTETTMRKQVTPKDGWIEVLMGREITASGAVVDATDRQKAVPNATVRVRVGGTDKTATSGEDGGFSIGVVPAGSARITAAAEGYGEANLTKEISTKDAWIEVPMGRLITAKGAVVEADNPQQAVAGARVSVTVGGVRQEIQAGADGGFSVSVPAGDAEARATADGFCEGKVSKKITAEDAWLSIPLLRGASVTGVIVNAVNNKPVPGATVSIDVQGVQQSGSSGADGSFKVDGVPAGTAAVDISADGFEPLRVGWQVGSGGGLRAVLSPDVPPGEVRLVLTWGDRPRDLDGHLYGPQPYGGPFHVFFDNRTATGTTLDVDAKTGFGPETITMRAREGAFQYYVTHPENLGTPDGQGLTRSAAQVRVYYKGNKNTQPYLLPSAAGGPAWHVLDIVVDSAGGITVAPKNQWLQDLPK